MRGNHTGVGGFRDHPEHINRNGVPKGSFTFNATRYKAMNDRELEEVIEWDKLSRYHYLTGHMKTTAKTYGLYNPHNRLIGICATITMPRNNGTAMMRIHRIVIHPDYQGIGLGKRFVTIIAKLESKKHDVFIQTSNPAMKHALLHYSDWVLQRNGRKHRLTSTSTVAATTLRMGKTATFVMRKEQ